MSQESQSNSPLSGIELKDIIVRKVEDVLQQDGMLASHIAYNTASFEITVKIKTSNPMVPIWKNKIRSVKSTKQEVEKNPTVAAIESFPHVDKEGEESIKHGVVQQIDILSPNQSRVENGIPVPIRYRNSDGEFKEERAYYDYDAIDPNSEFADKIAQRDLSEEEFDKETD